MLPGGTNDDEQQGKIGLLSLWAVGRLSFAIFHHFWPFFFWKRIVHWAWYGSYEQVANLYAVSTMKAGMRCWTGAGCCWVKREREYSLSAPMQTLHSLLLCSGDGFNKKEPLTFYLLWILNEKELLFFLLILPNLMFVLNSTKKEP